MSYQYTNTSSIRIAVADDHPLFRKGLSTILKQQAGFEVIGEAGNGMELVGVVAENKPDVVITDVNMPVMCGVEATAIIRKSFPQTNVIALSMHDGRETVLHMLEAGAKGYLLKNSEEAEMIQAIHTVHGNGIYYCTTASEKMRQLIPPTRLRCNQQSAAHRFSERDIEIIRLLCQERGSKEIAAELRISCRAVEGARERILAKMGVRNMIGIAVYAIQHGIFRID